MEIHELERVMNIINYGFQDKQMEIEKVAIYTLKLRNLPFLETMRVLDGFLDTRTFRPSLRDIREGVAKQLISYPPTTLEAIDMAARQAEYREQLSFVNGTSWRPTPPENVHPLVARTCDMMRLDTNHDSWIARFSKVYEEERERVIGEKITNAIGQLQLGSGNE